MKVTYHLILVLHQELDTLNGGRGGLGDSLESVEDVERHVAEPTGQNTHRRHTTHHEVDCSWVPGQQSKSTAQRAQDADACCKQRIRTKELLGSLAFLNVGHFDGGGTERREGLSGGGRQVGGTKCLACERLSTFSDSAGICNSESHRPAGPSKFRWPNHIVERNDDTR